MTHTKPKIVVLGGGNGTSRLMTALLPLLSEKRISSLYALVHMADDGGSTGRLREQYGVAAMGDLTKCLMAISGYQGDVRGDEFLRALGYRFASGDFQGHTLRNIFLAALEKTSDIDSALATMARILQVPKYAGVVPTTLTSLTEQVVIRFGDKTNLLGENEHAIAHRVNLQADPRWQAGDVEVTFAEGDVALNPRARQILEEATHIIVAPGHTYGTILPTLALPDLGRTVAASKAEVWVVMTLLTTPRQTVGWSGEDFVSVYESYLKHPVSLVITNRNPLSTELVEGQDWVEFSADSHPYKLLIEDVVSMEAQKKQMGDVVPRAIVVHDAVKLRAVIAQQLGC